ncbi:MAG: 4-(cytidine 5'-diphospho)-2-C-methyl-D-erythritol kinase [Candidatus Zixiibacteriota bacterium]
MFVKKITKSQLAIDVPAKVNMFLEVLSRRDDGYHNINSLFQAVSLYDRITFTVTESQESATVESSATDIPKGPDNLMIRAFEAMKSEFALEKGLKAKIDKNIPVAAGLAGGSADAAATLVACNLLFDLNLSPADLALIGLRIGSDVPFFFGCGQAIVTGRGETVLPAVFPTDYWLVLVKPSMALSTAEAYAGLRMDLTAKRPDLNLSSCRSVEELVCSLEKTGNDFEKGHLRSFPELERIKDGLLANGARLVRMSGSGPTMFGVFFARPTTGRWESFDRADWQVFTVRPVRFSDPGWTRQREDNCGDH